jgi:hypothetical protein
MALSSEDREKFMRLWEEAEEMGMRLHVSMYALPNPDAIEAVLPHLERAVREKKMNPEVEAFAKRDRDTDMWQNAKGIST